MRKHNVKQAPLFPQANNEKLSIDALYVLIFSVHIGCCYYIYLNGVPTIFSSTPNWIREKYSLIGFDWTLQWANLISIATMSSFILNAIRRTIEGWLFGWPRFALNNSQTMLYLTIRAAGYSVLGLLALGAYGELRSYREVSGVEVAFLAIATFIFGLLVNVIDDFISSFIQVVFKGERA